MRNPFLNLGKNLGKSLGKWADAFFDMARGKHFSANEERLGADAYSVKHKLGNSFFTRKLGARTRQRRIRSLTTAELQLAREQGWL